MTDILNWGWLLIAVVGIVLSLYTRERARELKRECEALRVDLGMAVRHCEFLETHAGAWEQRATDAEADLDAMKAQRDNIQALYTDFVRKTFGERVWVVQWSKTKE